MIAEENKNILIKTFKKLGNSSKLSGIYKILTKEWIDKKFSCLLNSKSDLLPLKAGSFNEHIVVDLKTGLSRQRKKERLFLLWIKYIL